MSCSSAFCKAQNERWRLYDPKHVLVPIGDLYTGYSNLVATDSMYRSYKAEAIARAKHELAQESLIRGKDLVIDSQDRLIDEQGIQIENQLDRIEDLEDDIHDQRPWVVIGKSFVVMGSVVLVGATTIKIIQATN